MIATRYLLTVERPTPSGASTYQHIAHVAEYRAGERTPEQERRHFRALCRRKKPAELADPTAKIVVEKVQPTGYQGD